MDRYARTYRMGRRPQRDCPYFRCGVGQHRHLAHLTASIVSLEAVCEMFESRSESGELGQARTLTKTDVQSLLNHLIVANKTPAIRRIANDLHARVVRIRYAATVAERFQVRDHLANRLFCKAGPPGQYGDPSIAGI